jgi:hypothetical protein
MSMGELYEHGKTACAYEGVNGVNIRFFLSSSTTSCFSLRKVVHQFSPYSDFAFLGFLLIYALLACQDSVTVNTQLMPIVRLDKDPRYIGENPG